MQVIIKIENGVTRMPEWRLKEPAQFELCDNEHIAIVGPNGGGKSLLGDMITCAHPLLMNDPEYDLNGGRHRFLDPFFDSGKTPVNCVMRVR